MSPAAPPPATSIPPANVDLQPKQTIPSFPDNPRVDLKEVLKVIVALPELDHNQSYYPQEAYTKGSAVTFRYLCDLIEVDHSTVPYTNAAKRAVFNLMMHAVST